MFLLNMDCYGVEFISWSSRLVVHTLCSIRCSLLFPYTDTHLFRIHWKNVFLAFGYTFLIVQLVTKEKTQQRFSFWQWVLFWILLICTTDVKIVQTRFICPFDFWVFANAMDALKHTLRVIVTVLSWLLIFGIHIFHKKVFQRDIFFAPVFTDSIRSLRPIS